MSWILWFYLIPIDAHTRSYKQEVHVRSFFPEQQEIGGGLLPRTKGEIDLGKQLRKVCYHCTHELRVSAGGPAIYPPIRGLGEGEA